MKPLALVAAVALLSVAACAPASEPDGESESALIGGDVVPASELPSTLQIPGNCTVTRIGERLLLTAAHCVANVSGFVRGELRAPANLEVVVRGSRPGPRTLAIVSTKVHPRYERLCSETLCAGVSSKDTRDAPDVAVIEVDGGLDGVAIAKVATAPAAIGGEVDLVGYGCRGAGKPGDGQLRRGTTKAITSAEALEAGEHSFWSLEPEKKATLAEVYTLTLGPALDAAQPGLCYGDSGGPLFLSGTEEVVGVNASYTVSINNTPRTNWHARTDGAARWGVAAWLESVGATMTAPCTPETCVAVAR